MIFPWFSHRFPIDLTIFLAQPRPANFSNSPGPVPRGSDIWQTPASWIWAQNMGTSGKVWNIMRVYSYLLDFLDSFGISLGYCSYFELYSYWYEGRPWIFEGWFLMESLWVNQMAFGVMKHGGQLGNLRTKWKWWKLGKTWIWLRNFQSKLLEYGKVPWKKWLVCYILISSKNWEYPLESQAVRQRWKPRFSSRVSTIQGWPKCLRFYFAHFVTENPPQNVLRPVENPLPTVDHWSKKVIFGMHKT